MQVGSQEAALRHARENEKWSDGNGWCFVHKKCARNGHVIFRYGTNRAAVSIAAVGKTVAQEAQKVFASEKIQNNITTKRVIIR